MTAPVLTALAFAEPCPDWCQRCDIPDPGVVDHYSRTWDGRDYYDDATWLVQVTQRVSREGTEPARIIVGDALGTYASVAGLGRALVAAEALKDRINAGLRRVS